MIYHFGMKSAFELRGVHPDLTRVARRALELTEQDFSVHDGRRTVAEQAAYVEAGVSWTMDSCHLPQEDGYSHAMDLVPYVNRRLRWEWLPIYRVFEAVRRAATEQDVGLKWGGCWSNVTGTTDDPERLVERYIDLRRRQGRRASPDGPHFELIG